VLVPLMAEALAAPKPDQQLIEDLVGLVALVPEPSATDAKAQDAWKKMMAALPRAGEKAQRTLATRRAASARERANPPPMIKKVNFCNAAAAAFPNSAIEAQ
jgi:ribonuclease D